MVEIVEAHEPVFHTCPDCGTDGPDVIYTREPLAEADNLPAEWLWICRRCYDMRIKLRGRTL